MPLNFSDFFENLAVPTGTRGLILSLPTVCHSVATLWAINRAAPPALNKDCSYRDSCVNLSSLLLPGGSPKMDQQQIKLKLEEKQA